MIKPLDRTGTWRTYSMAEGLAGMRIEHIAEDSEGYLWFATWANGVSRFDGDEFQNFTRRDGLINDCVYFIFTDSQKRLWLSTLNGVCRYDGANFHDLEDEGIAGRAVQFIYEDSESRIWFGGHRTLGYYDGTAFHDLIPLYLQDYEQPPSHEWPEQCRGIAQDPEGHLWFGFDYLIRFDGTSFHRYDEKDGFPRRKTGYAVGQDYTGKVWVGQHKNETELWCYADGTLQPVEVDLGGSLRSIQSDREGRMWFSTSKGVLYQDSDGFSRFTPADGLPHPAVKAVFQDREHQLWFATWGGVGLYDAQISVFDLGKKFGSIHDEISQIVQDRRGDIWIGYVSHNFRYMEENVGRFNGEQFALVGTESGFGIHICFAIYEDHDGTLWFGGRNGLFRYEDQRLKKIKTIAGLGERSVSAIAQDREGQFLFGCWESGPIESKEELYVSPLKLIYQRGQEFQTIFEETEKKDPLSRIGTVIAGRNSEVYFHISQQNFSVNGKSLARWHSEEGLKFYGIEDGLIDNNVNDLLLDRNGNLWIATLSGLSCFDGSTFSIFTTEAGLPSNRIRCLFEDSQGHLWLGTDGGVAHFDGRLFQTIKSPHIGPVLQIIEDHCDGTFWFGTVQNSLVRYRQQKNLPQIRLIQVVVDQVYQDLAEVIVSTAGQQVIFEYKGMSFSTHPRDMLYVYRLNGYESDWRPATRNMRAHYQDLPPGDYIFQVQAIDRDLNYSEIAQVRLSIVLDPRIEAFTDVNNRRGSQKFIGHSAGLREFQVNLAKIASTNITVLIMGETGVGKGLAARALHALSDHSNGPFIEINCGALPGTLIDSELFGHERGAFTSAVSHRLGRVELAEGGTLFLDEIGDMAVETQVKLLRLLEEGTFERIGSSQTLMAKTRIVAATNRNLKEMVSTDAFREDLYYRLNAFPMYLPPLRERKEDIPYLAEFFKHRMATHLNKQIGPLTIEVIEVLQAYHWPGNVRELEHTINRAIIVCQDSRIDVVDIGLISSSPPVFTGREIVPLAEYERDYILKVLKATNWKVKGVHGAAALLGLHPATLYGKMRKQGIKRLGKDHISS